MILSIFLLIVGLAILIAGAEGLVRGAASIAKRWGVSALVIGLTVVAFGTSMPELTVNMYSAWLGNADIAIGNVIGSNISNILLILGLSAVMRTLTVRSSTVWREIPFALLAAGLVFIFGNDALFDGTGYNAMTRTDGLALLAVFGIFCYYTFSIAKNAADDESETVHLYGKWASLGLIFLGLVGLVVGGKLLVDSAVSLATLAGLSDQLIGLTIVAVGTSFPELATSLVAVRKGHVDIAIGNVVGSNIFNVLWILGLTSTILQLPFNPAVNFDVAVNIIVTFILFVAMFIGKKHHLERWQGAVLILMYIAYVGYLVFRG